MDYPSEPILAEAAGQFMRDPHIYRECLRTLQHLVSPHIVEGEEERERGERERGKEGKREEGREKGGGRGEKSIEEVMELIIPNRCWRNERGRFSCSPLLIL